MSLPSGLRSALHQVKEPQTVILSVARGKGISMGKGPVVPEPLLENSRFMQEICLSFSYVYVGTRTTLPCKHQGVKMSGHSSTGSYFALITLCSPLHGHLAEVSSSTHVLPRSYVQPSCMLSPTKVPYAVFFSSLSPCQKLYWS